jgi:hypothetical protein
MAGIETFKSKVSLRNGMAFNNQFAVMMPSVKSINAKAGGVKKESPAKKATADDGSFLDKAIDTVKAVAENINLPSMSGDDPETLNLLCKSASLPEKQIMSLDRQVGMEMRKVANGYAVGDVSLTFYVLNDYEVKKYFDNWMSKVVNEGEKGYESVAYQSQITHPVTISQLSKPQMRAGFDIGPLDINFDIGGLSIYTVELEDAFPTSISGVEFMSDTGTVVELTVQLSYTRWKVKEDKRGLTDLIGGDVNLNLGGII